ncbi:MAG: site-specific DNA-methyltransferase [Planctomycetes bacterium]|nr:site-specific DNA-methyltransferase [Planctomycetota bacterium]
MAYDLPLFQLDDHAGPAKVEPIRIFSEETVSAGTGTYRKTTGEFWTERQRQMHSLHYVVSYRASFKPELPEFFISRYSRPGDVVLDPFNGRGTTALQANLMGRTAYGSDVNPMSGRITYPKCNPVSADQIDERLDEIELDPDTPVDGEDDFSMFYHPGTCRELVGLRRHLAENFTDADRFIELVALSRLHGHSPGFFSVYSFPQISVSAANQVKINERRNQAPDYRPIKTRILKKAKRSLADGKIDSIRKASKHNRFELCDARELRFPDACADLIVTSPPFLNKADYILDNWIELWFLGIDEDTVRKAVVQTHSFKKWVQFMTPAIAEMGRVLCSDGVAVVEVGEVMIGGGLVYLDEVIVDIVQDLRSGGCPLTVEEVLIHEQNFTKLANCFKVDNNKKGTNSHRLIVLRK